jgi:hypothetical protein
MGSFQYITGIMKYNCMFVPFMAFMVLLWALVVLQFVWAAAIIRWGPPSALVPLVCASVPPCMVRPGAACGHALEVGWAAS